MQRQSRGSEGYDLGHVRESEVSKLLPQSLDKRIADHCLLVVGLVLVSLVVAGIPANGTDVDHAVAELDKGAALDGNIEVGNVAEAEVDELLVGPFADVLDEAVGGQGLAELVRNQAVLGEAEVEETGDGDTSGAAKLLLLLDEVGAADKADGAFPAQLLEQSEHLGRGFLDEGTSLH